ncbi:hypothetical protein AB0K09_17335, partial [Streptomyces sp. NPDC049577]
MSTEGGSPGGTPGKQRRKHTPLAVISVAAAVLLAGGGGAYWASTAGDGDGGGSPDTSGGHAAPPPLALDGYGRTNGGGAPSQGIAVGEPDPNGTRYRAEGKLPDGPRTAPVYLSAREVTRGDVAALAKALGVQGEPRSAQGTWTVGGSPDASGPLLRVNEQGPGDWSYSRYGTPGGTGCVHPPGAGPRTEPPAPGKDVPGGDVPAPSAPSMKCPSFRDGGTPAAGPDQGGGPVSEDRAKAAATPVLKALGQDDAKLDAHRLFGAVRMVDADPVVNSTPTYGWRTSFQVGPDVLQDPVALAVLQVGAGQSDDAGGREEATD